MAIQPVLKFLQAARNLAKQGVKQEQIMEFAKREFGEVNDLLKRQIEQIFTPKSGGITSIKKPEGKVIEASFKPGKDKKGKVVEESPSQASGIMERIQGAANRLRQLQKEQDDMFKPKKGFDVAEGLTRTIARRILDKKNIQIGKRDPIDVYSDIFGEAVTDVKNLADELIEIDAAGGGTKNLDEMIKKEGLFDIDIPESPQRGMTDEEFRKFLKDKGVDPDDTGFASGGRVQYAFGSGLKLAGFLAIRGKTLKDEIRKAVQNLNVSGDRKLDADMAIDDMLEEFGRSRDEFDQKDILEAYDEAYKMLNKEVEMTKELAPKMMERMELKTKYPGIDDDLVTKIVEDTDPQRKAEVLATLDQSSELMNKGKSSEEVVDILKQGMDRKKQADGGLSYLMGM